MTAENTVALSMDDERCAFTIGENTVQLTSAEYRVLKAIASKPNQVITRSEIHYALYADKKSAAESNVLEVLISRLRSKFDAVGAKAVIRTVRGIGYSFAGVP